MSFGGVFFTCGSQVATDIDRAGLCVPVGAVSRSSFIRYARRVNLSLVRADKISFLVKVVDPVDCQRSD